MNLDEYQPNFVTFNVKEEQYTFSDDSFHCAVELTASGLDRDEIEEVVRKLDGLKVAASESLTDIALLVLKDDLAKERQAHADSKLSRDREIEELKRALSERDQLLGEQARELTRLRLIENELERIAGLGVR